LDNTRIDTLTPEGWQEVDFGTAGERPETRTALATIRDVLDKAAVVPSPTQVRMHSAAFAPEDKEFMRRVVMVYRGRMRLPLGVVNIANVRPYDLDFCATVDPRLVDTFVEAIQCRRWPTLVVYQNGHSYVMSDDYCSYLA